MLYGSEVAIHARIQEFFVRGGPGQSDKKSSDVFLGFFFVLSLFYQSQMVNFKEIFHFSRFKRGSNIFQGGSNFFQRGSNCLFPIETLITCDFPGGGSGPPPPPPPPPLWIRTCNQNEFINASSNGSDEPAQKHGLARAFSVRTHSFHAGMNQT